MVLYLSITVTDKSWKSVQDLETSTKSTVSTKFDAGWKGWSNQLRMFFFPQKNTEQATNLTTLNSNPKW